MLGKTEGQEKGVTEDKMVGWHQSFLCFLTWNPWKVEEVVLEPLQLYADCMRVHLSGRGSVASIGYSEHP